MRRHTPEVSVLDVESLSLCWRVESRRFQLAAGEAGLPELQVNGQCVAALTAEEWCALGDVLFRIGMDWPGGNRSPGGVSANRPEPVGLDPVPSPRRGRLWSVEEETRLLSAFDAGDDASDIARALNRSRAGVMARLVKLGRVEESASGLRFPLHRDTTKLVESAEPEGVALGFEPQTSYPERAASNPD